MMKANILLEQTKSLRCPGMGHQIRHLKLQSNSYFVPDKPGKMRKDEHVLYTKLVTFNDINWDTLFQTLGVTTKYTAALVKDLNWAYWIQITK